MKAPFYYCHAGTNVGPLNTSELRQHAATGQVLPEDRVWTDDAPAGCRARQIKGLFGNAVPAPRPASPTSDVPPPLPPPLPAPSNRQRAVPTETTGQIESRNRSLGGRAFHLLWRTLVELLLSVKAIFQQLGRTISYLRSRGEARHADQDALSSLQALGVKIESIGLGEPGLRTQLKQLREKRLTLAQGNASTKMLDAEERGLLIRLAKSQLELPKSPSKLEPELSHARQAQSIAVTARQSGRARSFLPERWPDRLRLACGAVLAAMAIWFLPSMPHPPSWISSLVPGVNKGKSERRGGDGAIQSSDWDRYQFPEAQFSLQLPEAPTRSEQTNTSEVTRGEAEKVISHFCELEGLMYQVIVTQLTAQGRNVQWSQESTGWRDSIRVEVVNAMPGTQLVSEQALQLGDLLGVEITTQEPDGDAIRNVRTRGYRFPDHSVYLIASSPKPEDLDGASVETFFSSLKLE